MKVGNEDPRFQKERLEFYRLITVTFVCSVFQIQNHRKIGIVVSANLHMESGMEAHTCNASTWKDEAGGLLRV